MLEWITHLFMWTTIIIGYGMILFGWFLGEAYGP